MIRFLSLVVVFLAPGTSQAQKNEVWNNPGLSQRGMQYGEQQIILRKDMSHCHGTAFDQTREVPDEQKRKALGIRLFDQCMAEKGWFAREPKPPKPGPKGPPETAT
jgi:hypothetical protein